MKIDQIVEFLINQGATGVLALCAIIALVFLWRAFVSRERKHDSDRNEWHRELKEINTKFLASNEKLLSSLQRLDDGQEKLYGLYNDLARKK